MRALALALLLPVLAGAAEPGARDLRLEWLPPENASGVISYRLYRTPQGGPEEAIELGERQPDADGTVRAVVGFLRDRTYRVELVAYNDVGVSGRSNALDVAAEPSPPRKLRIVLEIDGDKVRVIEP